MARESDQFVFSGERPSPAAAEIPISFPDRRPSSAATEIPISFTDRRQPPVSHQPPRPQQLPDLSPAAARKAPTLEIPVTFGSGPPPRPRTTHVPSVDSEYWLLATRPANEEWSPVDDKIMKLPESMSSKSEEEKERIRVNDNIKDALYGPDRRHRRLAIFETITENYWWGKSPEVMGMSQEEHSKFVVLNETSSQWPSLTRKEETKKKEKKKKRRN